jgi:hypothetical protein
MAASEIAVQRTVTELITGSEIYVRLTIETPGKDKIALVMTPMTAIALRDQLVDAKIPNIRPAG